MTKVFVVLDMHQQPVGACDCKENAIEESKKIGGTWHEVPFYQCCEF